VETCAVAAHENSPGEVKLVAYLVRKSDIPVSTSDLQYFLQQHLPDYMIPSTFVKIDKLPLLPSGKLDRSMLPQPEPGNILRDEPAKKPRTAIESKLTEIVERLLNVDSVGVNDNFFLLGGHSLLGTQLIALIRNEFEVEISLRTLFQNPTVAEIAAEIDRLSTNRARAAG
jgi:acyl carrier protein